MPNLRIVAGTQQVTPTPDPLRSAVSSAVLATRWGAAGFGITIVASVEPDQRNWTGVVVLAVCVFITTLRTFAPLELGAPGSSRWFAHTDVLAFSVCAGFTGGTQSPWAFCTMTGVGIASYGWGHVTAAATAVIAVVGVLAGVAVSEEYGVGVLYDSSQDWAVIAMFVVAALAGMFVRRRLIEVEESQRHIMGDLANLEHANELLRELSSVAIALPRAFSLREALDRIRGMLSGVFKPDVTVLITMDEHSDDWTPKISDGFTMPASCHVSELPEPFQEVIRTTAVVESHGDDPTAVTDSQSGIYMPLRARDRMIGVLGVESLEPGRFDHIEPALRDGLADIVALTIDNSRWFGRLRSLGAEDERIRVARDVHDRLGQWMTYIKMELERLGARDSVPPAELKRLEADAATALDELRETLRQLRTGVSDDRPLSLLATDLVTRFSERTKVEAEFSEVTPGERLPVPVENELLRILQEALNNVDRHASAEHVEVTWEVDGGNFQLTVVDDGRGFDPARAIRDQAYGVLGMRERAEVIGATLRIDSTLGEGTTVSVRAGQMREPALHRSLN